MNVVLPASGRPISQMFRGLLNSFYDVSLPPGFGAAGTERAQQLSHVSGTMPGPKVFHRELLATNFPQVFVHIRNPRWPIRPSPTGIGRALVPAGPGRASRCLPGAGRAA